MAPKRAAKKTDKKVRIGIIGCGGIANGKHISSLSKLKDIEMVAFCDIIPEKAEKAKTEYAYPLARFKAFSLGIFAAFLGLIGIPSEWADMMLQKC